MVTGQHFASYNREHKTRVNERIDFETLGSGVHFVKYGENMWAAYGNNPFSRPVILEAPLSTNIK
jgi:hypothetical protein